MRLMQLANRAVTMIGDELSSIDLGPLLSLVRFRAYFFLLAALAAFVAPVLGAYVAVQPWGTNLLTECAIMLMTPICFVIPMAAVSAALLRQYRRRAMAWLLLAVVALGFFTASGFVARTIRRRAFEQLATRSAGLVSSISAYQAKYGAPPARLDNLVPEFLSEVPRTQMAAYPRYKYLAGPSPQEWGGNPWVLYVDCGQGGFNWDRFIYLPLQNYPSNGYGGGIERIGTWGYVHE